MPKKSFTNEWIAFALRKAVSGTTLGVLSEETSFSREGRSHSFPG